MRTTSSSFRKGTSSIMGTLIFIGIIFTAFIPMLLVMRQADTLHEMRKHELGILDQERASEKLNFYAYPLEEEPDLTPDQDELILRIKNEGSVSIKIVNVWINDEEYHQEVNTQDVNIKSMETISLEPLPVILQDLTSYTVKVITEKGNVFSSEAGTLYYSSSADGWYTPSLGICVHINNLKGKYQILIRINLGDDPLPEHSYSSTFLEHGEIEEIFWVDFPGTYYVTIKKDAGGSWVNVIPTYIDEPIAVLWPASKPITDVYASGIFV